MIQNCADRSRDLKKEYPVFLIAADHDHDPSGLIQMP
jgi:hypothetical protein